MTRQAEDQARALDMSWIDIAVSELNSCTVIVDCADGWREFLTELHVEDCIDTVFEFPSEPGLYRWSDFTVGSWDEDNHCVIKGGTFTPYRLAALSPVATDGAAVIEQCAKIAEQFPKFVALPDRIVPAHDEMDDYGCIIGPVPEQTEKRKRLSTGSDIAAAIRALTPSPVSTCDGEGVLRADMLRALPGGGMDDSTFEAIEEALDRADAPLVVDGRWLTLPQRIAALRQIAVSSNNVGEEG